MIVASTEERTRVFNTALTAAEHLPAGDYEAKSLATGAYWDGVLTIQRPEGGTPFGHFTPTERFIHL